jgi:hypothetical protein
MLETNLHLGTLNGSGDYLQNMVLSLDESVLQPYRDYFVKLADNERKIMR